ncbi:hypothetical protein RHMOL_Rhmol08G0177400 [Rhododendron molle]|uniref:Uncharacterized protein n=1 Tax=Rhododendron molle TaxID=49168 RepID=A0ACC0MR09_RHOML|nr:hypothetical protein RHMOL_Rhmol08G0177400 [Rhododendron molle]
MANTLSCGLRTGILLAPFIINLVRVLFTIWVDLCLQRFQQLFIMGIGGGLVKGIGSPNPSWLIPHQTSTLNVARRIQ